MPSSKDQFPDPWDPNSAEGANQGSEPKDVADETVSDTDAGNDDFGLGELRDLLSNEPDTPQPSSPPIDNLEGLFPQEETSDSKFDDLFASLGLGSAASQPLEESQSAELPDLFSSLDASAEDPNLELFSAEQPISEVTPELPEPESLTNSDPFSLESLGDLTAESPIVDAVVPELPVDLDVAASSDVAFSSEQQNLDFVSGSAPELPLELETPATPNVDSSATDIQFPETLGLSSDSGVSDGDSDVSIPESPGVNSDPIPEVASPAEIDSVQTEPSFAFGAELEDGAPLDPISEEVSVPESEAAIPFVASSSLDVPEDSIAESTDETRLDVSEPEAEAVVDSAVPNVAPIEPLTPSSPTAGTEPIPVPPMPDLQTPSSSVDIPVVSDASDDTNVSSTGTEVASEDSSRVGAGSVSDGSAASTVGMTTNAARTASGSTPTYKQLLGGRQQIAALALILAGMGGVVGYGLSKAGIDNPFATDFNQPRIGLLADRDEQSEDDDATNLAESLGIGGTVDGPAEDSDNTTSDSEQAIDQLALNGAAALDQKSRGAVPFDTDDSDAESSSAADEQSSQTSTSSEADPAEDKTSTPPPIDISDVPPEHWAHPYVVAMYEQGIVPDFPDGKFQPDKPVTRAELAASIQRAFKDKAGNQPIPFSDISQGYWAKDAITHAVNTGFMSGYSEDIFQPEERIPRYQVLVSLVSGLGLSKIDDAAEAETVLSDFPDVEEMPKWALGQVAASQKANLIVGDPEKSGTLAPNRPATRAEANAMIYQALVNAEIIEDTARPAVKAP